MIYLPTPQPHLAVQSPPLYTSDPWAFSSVFFVSMPLCTLMPLIECDFPTHPTPYGINSCMIRAQPPQSYFLRESVWPPHSTLGIFSKFVFFSKTLIRVGLCTFVLSVNDWVRKMKDSNTLVAIFYHLK